MKAGLLTILLVLFPATAVPQQKQVTKKPGTAKPASSSAKKRQAKPTPADELAKLRQEFINAINDYKANLVRLRATYEKDVLKAQDKLVKSKELFVAGLISRKALEADEAAVAENKNKVADVDRRTAGAETQIADALLEADAESKLAKFKPVPRGGMVTSASFIRYNGATAWVLSDAWKVQQFFLNAFKRPLPISTFGQGGIHDRWRLDHHNAMDVSLQPDGAEGQALLNYLRSNGIPFMAFRQAIPGTATGPHIHIGRPSHHY